MAKGNKQISLTTETTDLFGFIVVYFSIHNFAHVINTNEHCMVIVVLQRGFINSRPNEQKQTIAN